MARNANDLYTDVLYRLKTAGVTQRSRNGEVKALLEPTIWTMLNPAERVLFNYERNANPYFHVMETVWMFAGSKEVSWLKKFNARIASYAEDNGEVNGAYGHRWITHFGRNQIASVVKELREDPYSRQAVIGMYDPCQDHLTKWRDRPCNTHIYFRIIGGALDMTVCNRSNDAVWGLAGANIVHMTYLQELVASAVGVPLGRYYVMTNNLHIYRPHYHLLEAPVTLDYYRGIEIDPYLLITGDCDWYSFLYECREFIAHGSDRKYTNQWLEYTVKPMYEHYMCRLNGDKDTYNTREVQATDWRLACDLWRERNQ